MGSLFFFFGFFFLCFFGDRLLNFLLGPKSILMFTVSVSVLNNKHKSHLIKLT